MLDDLSADVAELDAAGKQIAAEVAAGEAPDEVDEAIHHQGPGKEEMPAPAGREILVAREGDPAREGVEREERMAEIGAVADIEGRMSVEDLESAHQEEHEAEGGDPMREAHEPRMAGVVALRDRRVGGEDGGHGVLRGLGAARRAHILCVSRESKVGAPTDDDRLVAYLPAASSITRTTAFGCETKTAWLALTAVTLEPER